MDASEAARALGKIRTEKKAQSSADNLAKGRERLQDPNVLAAANQRRSEAQKRRWEEYRRKKAEQKGAESDG